VNVKKTKVIVFEAHKSVCQAFQYEDEAIEQLNSFKYLGVELHDTKGMQAAIHQLAMSGKKAFFALRRKCAEPRIFDLALQCQLFNALVKPMLNYGCEVWLDHMALEQLEVVHRAFLKLSLGVYTMTSSYVMLVKFGRFPLEIFWWQQTMRFLSRVSFEVDSDRMFSDALPSHGVKPT
jgi:hypothetical protein